MERVLNQEVNERNVNTKGVFIDTYFIAQRDALTKLGREENVTTFVNHNDDYSIAGFQVTDDDCFWYYKLYKNEISRRLEAVALTFCRLEGVNIDDLKSNKQYKF